jgi:hypothetical protein
MALPEFGENGDLPLGVHPANMEEVVERFGGGAVRRRRCTQILLHVKDVAARTGHLVRFVIFS